MASSEHPENAPATSGIQKPSGIQAPAEAPSVPLPALPPKPVAEGPSRLRLRGWLDALLVAVVLLFAFLAASFPADNPDFFRHTAIGRLLCQGQYHFGVDPFVYTADKDYFVNHSWLFALLMYGLYQLPSFGSIAVVVFKALAIVLLAEILLRTSRRKGQSLWIPAVCTALAILVASPRFFLQPACLSYLFLGATFFIVSKCEKRWWWLLPPLFALWVNCDAWFFLGPLTVALYLVGGLISFSREPEASANANASGSRLNATSHDWRTLGIVLAAGVAACLLNPHHIHAFVLPTEFGLSPAGGLIERDPQFFSLFISPLGKDYYRPNFGLSPAGLAYWPLLALGLISFGFLAIGQTPWPRLLVWAGFAVMSLYNARTIPFFAIVAGPIASLNWLDFAALRARRSWPNWSLGGRLLTLLLGLVLLIAAVPGWLQRSYPQFRRIGWDVQVNPSLQAMAEAIHQWNADGLLPEQPHWFNMDYEIASYLAWFAPGQRVFLDLNLPNSRDTAQDYRDVRKGLEQMASGQPQREGDAVALKIDFRKILRKNKVRYWIFDDRSAHRTNAIARAILFTQPKEWMLCHLQGRIAIFAWLDSQQPPPDPSPKLAFDFKRAAFGPKAEPAPPNGTEPAPPSEWWRTLWDAWRQPNPPPSSDREAVGLYDFYYLFEEKPRQVRRYTQIFRGALTAGAIANSLPHGPALNSLPAWSMACTYHDLYPPGAVQPVRQPQKYEEDALNALVSFVRAQFIEPSSLYLALRAGRRALSVDPEDGPTYFRLGQDYRRLHELPHEEGFGTIATDLTAIRRTQIAAAFLSCLRLQPDDDRAAQIHEALYRMYALELRCLDAAVGQLRKAIDRRTAAGPAPGEPPTQFNQILDRMSSELTRQESELTRATNRYEVRANTAKTELEKVRFALEMGLWEQALSTLEQSADLKPNSPLEVAIVRRATEAALDLGQLDRARNILPALEGPVRPEDVDPYVRLAAARGDYATADRLLEEVSHGAGQSAPGQRRALDASAQVAMLVGKVLLVNGHRMMGAHFMPWMTDKPADIFQQPWLVSSPTDFWVRRWRFEAIVNGLRGVQQQAEWNLRRGWLALEAGQCQKASELFKSVRDSTVQGKTWAPEVKELDPWLIPEETQSLQPMLQLLGFRQTILRLLSMRYLKWLEVKTIP